MPRQRTARIPFVNPTVAGSEGRRARGGSAFRARLVALGLVLLSLGLLTIYFRESSGGPIHDAQRAAVSVLTPFEAAAERVARPFRDAWGWASDVLDAKSENEKLEQQVEELRTQAIENATAAAENERLRALLEYRDGPRFPDDYDAVTTRVILEPQSAFRQEVVVAAGSSSGIQVNDPVVTDEGLVGMVVATTSNAANVRLLTDQESAASAYVLETGASGVIQRGSSTSAALTLDRVPKDEEVSQGDTVVTAGSQSGQLQSLFPRRIPICTVTSVSQRDIDSYKQIQCTPLVDFDAVHEVIVLVKKGSR